MNVTPIVPKSQMGSPSPLCRAPNPVNSIGAGDGSPRRRAQSAKVLRVCEQYSWIANTPSIECGMWKTFMSSEQLAVDSASGTGERQRTIWLAVILGLIALFVGADLVEDSKGGSLTAFHLALEVAIVGLCLTAVAVLLRSLRTAEATAARLGGDLVAARAEAERYRSDAAQALAGLGSAIDHQFERWGLTQAEREIALLLLKGLSHRDVAQVRSTNEATVRQQALAIYRKSNLRSRSELSAFFLEDLLLPRTAGAAGPPSDREANRP
jgi:DNA-binding CsgD family transcriptional regulator